MVLSRVLNREEILERLDAPRPMSLEVHGLADSGNGRRGLFETGEDSCIDGMLSDGHLELDDKLEITGVDRNLISPTGGIDFRVGELYESEVLWQVGNNFKLMELIEKGKLRKVNFTNGKAILMPDPSGRKIYFTVSAEKLKLPNTLDFIFDSKSTSARLGILCDNQSKILPFQFCPEPFVASVRPYAFPVEITEGVSSLHQGVLIGRGSQFANHDEIRSGIGGLYQEGKEIGLDGNWLEGYGMRMTHATKVFLRARRDVKEPISLEAKAGSYKLEDYYEIVEGNGGLIINPGDFVLGATEQRIVMGGAWGFLSRHVPKTPTGFLPHLAGFINPYWGGTITTEMRSESPVYLERGMDAMYIQFHKLSENEVKSEITGSYKNQEVPIPQPPRMFSPLVG